MSRQVTTQKPATNELATKIDWHKMNGLVPAIVQHADTGQVLMLAYMNEDALHRTLESAWVTFYSRSRKQIWVKGETSGNRLSLVSIVPDCDQDTLLVKARPAGPVCHTGEPTCFFDDAAPAWGVLGELEEVIAQRKQSMHKGAGALSYSEKLLLSGTMAIAQKVGEEGVEVALAGTAQSDAELIGEAADLMFHLQLLLASRDLSLADVCHELEQRRQ